MNDIYSTIVFAAQDTSASATSRVLHRLAEYPEAQARLRAEVRSLRSASTNDDSNEINGEEPWDYDALMRLPYLDAVVRETLRLHGPVSWIWRMYVGFCLDVLLPFCDCSVPRGGLFDQNVYLTASFLSVSSVSFHPLTDPHYYPILFNCRSDYIFNEFINIDIRFLPFFRARKPTSLPLRRPVHLKDGSVVNSIPVARHQGVILGIAAAHRDECVWGGDAWEWRPERWMKSSTGGDDEAKVGSALLDEDARYPGVYSGM